MKTFLALLFTVSLQVSLSQAQVAEIDRIIGANDFVLVKTDLTNIPPKFRSSMPAIGKLSSGCTVTHIGQGYAITAGHCFWQTFFDEELKLNEKCSDETITWAWTEGSTENKTSECLEVVAMQRSETDNFDFAIMKISNPPAAKIDIEWKKKPKAGSFVTIFSYPEEAPLSWSKYCRIKKLTPQDVLPGLMHHVCDTLTGSSGAAILDMVTGKIVALHKSGDGEILDDGTTTPAIENYAMYITQSPIKNLLIKSGYVIKN
jgi:V8-like Glu-specific endopeptidase